MGRRLPRLLLPFLKPFYDWAIPLSWLVLRVGCGWVLPVHGWTKVTLGPAPFGPVHAVLCGGGCDHDADHHCLYFSNGFSWLNRGYEFVLLWGFVAFAIAWGRAVLARPQARRSERANWKPIRCPLLSQSGHLATKQFIKSFSGVRKDCPRIGDNAKRLHF
jgi:hypothetical protein